MELRVPEDAGEARAWSAEIVSPHLAGLTKEGLSNEGLPHGVASVRGILLHYSMAAGLSSLPSTLVQALDGYRPYLQKPLVQSCAVSEL